ncbi:MAG: hypothetical protein VX627_00540 [Candidatus Thermoplasmatota archaeon]|nr:hypothetical protein [Candidatus Thermoplasmatota archaeon]
MDVQALLDVSPEELASAILQRRRFLHEHLPTIESRSKDEMDQLGPSVEKLRLARDSSLNKVADLKQRRNNAQTEAKALLEQTKILREKLEEGSGMKSLDPKWAKVKLEENLADVEAKIEKGALSLTDERRLLAERKSLLEKNDEWLKARRENNPEMAQYVDSSKKMQRLFKTADKLHSEMLDVVEKQETVHENFIEFRDAFRNSMKQLERSQALIKQSETSISYWEKRLENGFGPLIGGEQDLLENAKRVESGGHSSVRRRDAELPNPDVKSSRGDSNE